MKLMDAIRRIDELKHNTYTIGEKIQWLSELDGSVKKLVLDTHEGPEKEFPGYTEKDAEDGNGPELLIQAPWDNVYILWLEAQIDYYNGEMDRYNNSAVRYSGALTEWMNHYHRTHMPLGGKFKGV